VSVGDYQFEKFNPARFKIEIIINDARSYRVIRDGNELELPIDERFSSVLSSQANKEYKLFTNRLPYIIDEIREGSPADQAGFEKGDRVVTVNGEIKEWRKDILKVVVENAGKEVDLGVIRPGRRDTLNLTPVIGDDGRLGVYTEVPGLETQKYSFLESIPKGVERSVDFLSSQLKAFGQMFKGRIKAKESLGSVISIAKEFGPTWEWQRFWTMTASLSILLAFLNLLPIPGLDGGHVMFLIYEVVSGKKPSDKVMEYSTIAGFILLVLLMIFALGLDISRLL
jgi:regulator of sigma E protease